MKKPNKNKLKIIINDKKYRKIEKELIKFSKGWVLVGFFEGEKLEEGLTVAQVAFFNEFGTDKIPERPFLRGWVDSNKTKIKNMFVKITNLIKDLKLTAEQGLKRIGEWAVGEIKKFIISLKSPPNALSTIMKKKSSNPLIDTGQMLNTVKYKIGFGPLPEGVNN